MTLKEVKQKVIEAEKSVELGVYYENFFRKWAKLVYDECPFCINLNSSIYNLYNIPDYVSSKPSTFCNYKNSGINTLKTKNNIINWINNNRDKVYILVNCMGDTTIWTPNWALQLGDLLYCSPTEDICPEILSCFVEESKEKVFKYVLKSGRGFEDKTMPIKNVDINLEEQYNNSLPHQKITEFINSKSSGVVILHGIPGCGKTTYIRHLIAENPDLNFYFLDSSIFAYITDASFIEYLLDNKNGIFILEDCESLLASRNTTYNGNLSALLNISDGVLGDGLNIKFICTFNSDLSNIDSALLRKGRLKVKYEFDKLDQEKSQKLINSLGKEFTVTEPMALCDIYNLDENTGVKQKRKVGFA